MIKMDHEELLRRFQSDPQTMPEHVRQQKEIAQEQWRKQMESGEWAQPKEGDNFPIGLDNNFEPFPVRERPGDDEQESGEHSSSDEA